MLHGGALSEFITALHITTPKSPITTSSKVSLQPIKKRDWVNPSV